MRPHAPHPPHRSDSQPRKPAGRPRMPARQQTSPLLCPGTILWLSNLLLLFFTGSICHAVERPENHHATMNPQESSRGRNRTSSSSTGKSSDLEMGFFDSINLDGFPPIESKANPMLFSAKALQKIDPAGRDALLDNEKVRSCFYCIYDQAGYGKRDFERAAWVTEIDGSFSCISTGWTSTGSGMARWVGGPRPKGYQAIVHSHPTRSNRNRSSHEPSDKDIHMARNLKPRPAPIYTVTPRGIWKYDPLAGPLGATTKVAGAHWFRNAGKKYGKRCHQILQ